MRLNNRMGVLRAALLICVALLSVLAGCAACEPPQETAAVQQTVATASPEPQPISLSLTAPDKTAAGDLLIAQICYASARGITVTPPSADWVLIAQTTNEAGICMASFYRWVTQAQAQPETIAFQILPDDAGSEAISGTGRILRYTGIDSSRPIAGSDGESGDGTILCVNEQTLDDSCVVLALFGQEGGPTEFTLPDGETGMQTMGEPLTDQGLTLVALRQELDAGTFPKYVVQAAQSGAWVSQLITLRLAPVNATFDAGEHGSLTKSRQQSVSVSVRGGITEGDIPVVNANYGYGFLGWRTDRSARLLDAAEVCALPPKAGDRFTAEYVLHTYTVQFNLGENGTSVDQLLYKNLHRGDEIRVPGVTAKSGWTFDGWDSEPQMTVHSNAAYTAKYSRPAYTVRFLLGEHGTSTGALTFSDLHAGDTITVPTVTAKSGWTFLGWNTTPATTVSGNADYTAQYAVSGYTVTFQLGTHGTSGDTLSYSGLAAGDTIGVPSVTPEDGWSFDGWDVTPETTVSASATYTAVYSEILYTVHFYVGSQGTSTDTLTFSDLHYGDRITIPNVTPNGGYVFLGWSDTPSETVVGDADYTALYRISRDK